MTAKHTTGHDMVDVERMEGGTECRICGGAEGALPTDCPGRSMTGDELDFVNQEGGDFVSGQWVTKANALASASAGGWVSVDERLPADGQYVIAAYWPYDNHENQQCIVGAYFNQSSGDFLSDTDGDAMHPPSHWKPAELPTDPKSAVGVQALADCRLAANAPELLAALSKLCTLEADGMQAAESAIEAWEQARAAIAKATGEAQP